MSLVIEATTPTTYLSWLFSLILLILVSIPIIIVLGLIPSGISTYQSRFPVFAAIYSAILEITEAEFFCKDAIFKCWCSIPASR